MTNRTENQIARQHDDYRTNGRYAKVNPCECCGKSAGVDFYSDNRICNSPKGEGRGLILCNRCADKVADMDVDTAIKHLQDRSAWLAANPLPPRVKKAR